MASEVRKRVRNVSAKGGIFGIHAIVPDNDWYDP